MLKKLFAIKLGKSYIVKIYGTQYEVVIPEKEKGALKKVKEPKKK